jgi:hypothetical protein
MLERTFDFHHTTIQVETVPCTAPSRDCGPRGSVAHATDPA